MFFQIKSFGTCCGCTHAKSEDGKFASDRKLRVAASDEFAGGTGSVCAGGCASGISFIGPGTKVWPAESASRSNASPRAASTVFAAPCW